MARGAGGLHFRAIKGAVPLKRAANLAGTNPAGGFPRHQRRGPIEASTGWTGGSRRCIFPRHQRRGPIEAIPPD